MKPTTNKKRKANDSTTILPPAKRAKKRLEPPLPPISEEDETIEILDFRMGTYNPSSKRAVLVSSKLVLCVLLLDRSDEWISMEIRFDDLLKCVTTPDRDTNEETCAICCVDPRRYPCQRRSLFCTARFLSLYWTCPPRFFRFCKFPGQKLRWMPSRDWTGVCHIYRNAELIFRTLEWRGTRFHQSDKLAKWLGRNLSTNFFGRRVHLPVPAKENGNPGSGVSIPDDIWIHGILCHIPGKTAIALRCTTRHHSQVFGRESLAALGFWKRSAARDYFRTLLEITLGPRGILILHDRSGAGQPVPSGLVLRKSEICDAVAWLIREAMPEGLDLRNIPNWVQPKSLDSEEAFRSPTAAVAECVLAHEHHLQVDDLDLRVFSALFPRGLLHALGQKIRNWDRYSSALVAEPNWREKVRCLFPNGLPKQIFAGEGPAPDARQTRIFYSVIGHIPVHSHQDMEFLKSVLFPPSVWEFEDGAVVEQYLRLIQNGKKPPPQAVEHAFVVEKEITPKLDLPVMLRRLANAQAPAGLGWELLYKMYACLITNVCRSGL